MHPRAPLTLDGSLGLVVFPRMRVTFRGVVAAAVAVMGAAVPVSGQTSGSASRSVLDGVYTAVQAGLGRTAFLSVCANCHTSSQFKGSAFQANWAGRSILALVEQLRSTMPIDNPGGLSRAEYASIVAYMLQLNGYPAGRAALPSDDDGLKRIRIEQKADSAGSGARVRSHP